MMPAFWPGVREEQVKCFDRSFGEQVTDGVRTFDVENTNVFQRGRFAASSCHAPDQSINAKKVCVRMTLRLFAQERAVAATKIDMQWRDAPKERDQVERSDVCLRKQFDH